jgi:hypothetical protein
VINADLCVTARMIKNVMKLQANVHLDVQVVGMDPDVSTVSLYYNDLTHFNITNYFDAGF